MATSKADKEIFQEKLEELKSELEQTQEALDFNPSDFFPDTQDVDLDLTIEMHDYEMDLQMIRSESKDTLECIANLYLDEKVMSNKNINNIIRNDALALSDLKFSISCAKRGLINLMRQIDGGSVDADLYQSVSMFQREMKEGIQVLYKLQKDMKLFFKELKDELKDINVGDTNIEASDKYKGMKVTDRDINKTLEKILNDKKEKEKEIKK
ncbi:MAG: hypothetical protein JXA99_11985 [Candidatus Lokiarchaeota archaeon]|nr:hypothetical protein [Candidatus Lokiarchaeota archaeon]